MCAFIPKCHWFPFFVWCISGSRSPDRFLVDDGASMMLASTMVPSLSRSPCDSRWALISSNSPLPSSWRSRRWRKLRMVVSSGRASVRLRPMKRLTDSAS